MGSLYIWVFPKKHWIRHWKPKMNLIKLKKLKKRKTENIVYKTNGYTYSFKIFRTIKTFDKDIYDDEINLKEADEDQSSLSVEILNIRKQIKHKSRVNKTTERKYSQKLAYTFYLYRNGSLCF